MRVQAPGSGRPWPRRGGATATRVTSRPSIQMPPESGIPGPRAVAAASSCPSPTARARPAARATRSLSSMSLTAGIPPAYVFVTRRNSISAKALHPSESRPSAAAPCSPDLDCCTIVGGQPASRPEENRPEFRGSMPMPSVVRRIMLDRTRGLLSGSHGRLGRRSAGAAACAPRNSSGPMSSATGPTSPSSGLSPRRSRIGLGAQPDRPLHPGRAGGAGLATAPEADRVALIRRVTFDLTGLPPTPDEVDAFLGDDRPDAYERLVDRLLASPALRRALGPALARPGPLRRLQRLRARRRAARRLALSRLGRPRRSTPTCPTIASSRSSSPATSCSPAIATP